MHNPDDLSSEDIERVNNVINSGYNDTQRGPFRFWRLLGILWAIVTLLGLIALGLGRYMENNLL